MKLLFISLCLLHTTMTLAQVRPKLNLGIVLPRSGALGLFGEQTLKGAQLALKEEQNKDETLRELISVSFEDSESSTTLAKEAAERLIVQRKSHIIFGGVTSSESLALAEVAHDRKRGLLTPLATHLDVTRKSRYVFRTNLTDPEQGSYGANFVFKQLKKKRAAILYNRNSSYSRQLMRTFEHRYKKMGGKIVAKEFITGDSKSFQATLTSIKRANAEIVFAPLSYRFAAQIIKQAKTIALTIPFVGAESWNSPSFFKILDKYSARGHYYITSYHPTELEEQSKKFVEAYRSEFKETPSYYSAMGYDGMKTIIHAYKRTKGDVTSSMVRSLAATRKVEGVLGSIDLNRFRNALKPAMALETTANGAKFHSLIKVR